MTVGELVVVLSRLDPEAEVMGTWEGIDRDVTAVFRSHGSDVVMIDVDDGGYVCDTDEIFYANDAVRSRLEGRKR